MEGGEIFLQQGEPGEARVLVLLARATIGALPLGIGGIQAWAWHGTVLSSVRRNVTVKRYIIDNIDNKVGPHGAARWGGVRPICARIPWVPLDNMPLGCNGHALLFARLAAIEDIKRLGRQPL